MAELCRPRPIVRRHQPPHRGAVDAEKHFENYLRKSGGIPPIGSGSDDATFRAAAYVKTNITELEERQFVATILHEQPDFDENWIISKWRSARGR